MSNKKKYFTLIAFYGCFIFIPFPKVPGLIFIEERREPVIASGVWSWERFYMTTQLPQMFETVHVSII